MRAETCLDAILQQRQGEFVCGVAREPESEARMDAFPRSEDFLLPKIRQVSVDPALGEVTVLQYHPPAPLRRRPDGGLGNRALALAQRQRDPGGRLLLLLHSGGEPLDLRRRVGARREEHDERARRLRDRERFAQVERRRRGEVGAQVGGDERAHGRQNGVGPENARQNEPVEVAVVSGSRIGQSAIKLMYLHIGHEMNLPEGIPFPRSRFHIRIVSEAEGSPLLRHFSHMTRNPLKLGQSSFRIDQLAPRFLAQETGLVLEKGSFIPRVVASSPGKEECPSVLLDETRTTSEDAGAQNEGEDQRVVGEQRAANVLQETEGKKRIG